MNLLSRIKEGISIIKDAVKDVLSGQRFAFGGLPKPGQQSIKTAPTDTNWRPHHL